MTAYQYQFPVDEPSLMAMSCGLSPSFAPFVPQTATTSLPKNRLHVRACQSRAVLVVQTLARPPYRRGSRVTLLVALQLELV